MRSDDGVNSPLKAWVRALEMTAAIARNPGVTLPVVIDNLADKFGSTIALTSDSESLSYRALSEEANRYARWALDQGLVTGDVVCLMMQNCPEYMAIWLGITHTGVIVSLLNTNLVGDALVHAIGIVAPKHLIVGADLVEAIAGVLPRLGAKVTCWAHGDGGASLPRIDHGIQGVSGDRLGNSTFRAASLSDRALYIYTSGTTGLPKAANVSHHRLMQWSHWFAGMLNTGPGDRMYDCLPMYHSVGGVVAIGATLVNGGCVVLRQRFSARQFWEEIVRWDCTLFQYIGELCRFLVNSPIHPMEREHHIRICCGNGLRPDVWDQFQARFRIPQILEFFAATEANFSLYNCEGKPGAIGRIPSFLAHRFPLALIRFDIEAGEPIRNGEGFCVRCSTNEVGEAISKIHNDPSSPGSQFDGYTDRDASESKVLRNVFVAGDAWFRSGDLMRRDAAGFFYFVDRIGDTFRWKGENVSTTEVAEVMSAFPGVIEAIAYGVTVPGTDGRAGMVAVVAEEGLDLAALHQHVVTRLPEYARPLFVRFLREIEMTTTFKPKKHDLSVAGYDPTITPDAIYFNDRTRAAFVRLDAALFEQIESGAARV